MIVMKNYLDTSPRKKNYTQQTVAGFIRRAFSPLFLLFFLLAVSVVFGGSSRDEVPGLMLLRPLSVALAVYIIARTPRRLWLCYRNVIAAYLAIIALICVHLIPLPPSIWQALPGREIIADIFVAHELGAHWLPISMNPAGSLNALYFMATPLAALFLTINVKPKNDVKILIFIIILIMSSIFVGVLQASGIKIKPYDIVSATPSGLFANRNHQGAFIALLVPMAALLVTTIKFGRSGRLAALAIMGVSIAALVPIVLVTGSRMGLFLFIFSIAAVVFMRIKLLSSLGVVLNIKTIVCAVAVLAILPLILILIANYNSRDVAIERLADIYDQSRLSVWKQTWDLVFIYMPWGSGIGTYAQVYQIGEPPLLLQSSYSNHAHNEILEVLLTAGVPGAILLIGALTALVIAAVTAWRSGDESGRFARLGVIIILVLGIASVVDYPLRTPALASILAVASVWTSRVGREMDRDEGYQANV